MFSSMSTGAKVGVLGGGGGIAMSMLLYRLLPGSMFFYIMIGTALVGVLLGLFGWLVRRARGRKAKPMERSLRDNSAATPQGVAEPGRRARLDDLRKNFEDGVEKFKAAGKNLYSLPWYVLVGEPGSGKTEAVRHCNVGFPPGLQDQLQGVGGTINMNWWFTNHAIILDTAGRLMFEEVEPGATSEWREFLKLLRNNRPNCPINGMLLCIPADSLIKDTADSLERKGAKIAQQLDQIQRALGVRFPVFVMITKCDLINGFREFFEDVTDPQLQHQMLGWSNPDPLDQSFNPELVDQHLQTVADRLQRRRLGLLLDPVNTEDPSARRTDQVDALYAFPQAMMTIAPRLRRYLEMIFVAGEWSAKPLFLRGIYFTSSMREGSALDAELAEALGVPVESLPEGKVWERDRAYFLRDLFMNKVFKEKGLVTNATNAKRRQRRRKAAVLVAGFVAVLFLSAFTWWGYSSFQRSVGAEAAYWFAAADEDNWTPENHWWPIVSPEYRGSEKYTYAGMNVVETPAGEIPAGQFHYDTMQKVKEDIHIPWVFGFAELFGADINENRHRAQRVLFEAGVLRPIIDATRKKVLSPQSPWSSEATMALAQLLRMERAAAWPDQPVAFDANHLFDYVLQDNLYKVYRENDADNLDAVFEWTYVTADQPWPPKSVSVGGERAVAAVNKGVDDFIDYWKAGGGIEASEILDAILGMKTALTTFGDAEAELLALDDRYLDEPAQPDSNEVLVKIADEWRKRLDGVKAASGSIESAVATARLGTRSLVEQYDVTIAQRLERAEGPHKVLVSSARPDDASKPGEDDEKPAATIASLRKHLTAQASRVSRSLENLEGQYKQSQDRKELLVLDPQYLLNVEVRDEELRKLLEKDNLRLYDLRLHMYRTGTEELGKRAPAPEMAGLAPAVADVREDTRRADRLIGDLAALAIEGHRVKEATTASQFVTGRLAKRKRIYELLKGVLQAAPKNANEVAAKVTEAVKAGNLTPIPRPVVPGTNFKPDQTFPPQFHRAAAKATFAGWQTIADYVHGAGGEQPGGVTSAAEVINRRELEGLYKTRQDAYNAYLRQYQEYWIRDVLADLSYNCPDWKTFQEDLIGIQPRTVAENLERLGRTILASLREVKDVVPASQRASFDQAVQDLAADIDRFGTSTYMGQWKGWLRRWKELGSEPGAARKIILAKSPAQFVDDYIPFSAGVDTMISEKYWKELAYTGLKLLAREIDTNVQAAYQALHQRYSRFPLADPQANVDELSPAEAALAREAVLKVLGAAQVYDAKTIGGGARTRKFETIDQQLDRLCGLGLDPAKRAWCVKAKDLLSALPPSGEKYECTVRVIGAEQQQVLTGTGQSALGMWAAVQLDQGGVKRGIRNITQPKTKEAGKVDYPGKPVVLKFYRYPVDVNAGKVNKTQTIPGSWAPLRMLHVLRSQRDAKDGKLWQVEVVVQDSQNRSRSLWLELEFAKPLPRTDEWP